MVIITKLSDLTIRVKEPKDDSTSDANQKPDAEFQVCKEVLIKSSPVFKSMLSSHFAEATQNTVTLEGDPATRPTSMGILFRLLHGTVTDDTYAVPLGEVWNLVAACDKWDLEINNLEDWFAKWYGMQDVKKLKPRELLYPCWRLDHAKGFATATRSLAYSNIGHITESNPTKHYQLHLPSRVIQQLNAAKGRLRTIIHSELFKPNEQLLEALCPCKEKTLYGYEEALWKIEVWPLERTAQKQSMGTILELLDKFAYEPQKNACSGCHRDYKALVNHAQVRTQEYFNGLCLDCMDKSKPKTGDVDRDYWHHNDLREDDWVRGCRFSHKQPTWYFSFMGRREDRDHFRRRKRSGRHWDDSD